MVTLLTDIQAKESKGLAKLIPKKAECLKFSFLMFNVNGTFGDVLSRVSILKGLGTFERLIF